jgi:uncharacterized SAM-binding protein YcdF (DUF218 family)
MRPKSNSKEQGGIVTTLIALLFLVVLCVAVYLVRHPIMRFAAEEWIVDEPAAHADAIIVLSDDNFYADRATHAAELYRQGVAPVVVASGRRLRPSAGISELMEHDLVERGVPKDKIIRYPHDADNTREEAEMIGKIAKANHWKNVVIVTSNYHTRRARYIFGKVFPAGITVSIASARDGDFDPERWWEKRKSVKLFTREIAGLAEAMWELKTVSRSVSGSVAAGQGMILPDQICTLGHIPGKAVPCPLHHISATLSLRL